MSKIFFTFTELFNDVILLFREFFHLCDGIFTNYNWSVRHLEKTSQLIDEKYPNRRQDVFFGIDVFGRGQVAKFQTDEVNFINLF